MIIGLGGPALPLPRNEFATVSKVFLQYCQSAGYVELRWWNYLLRGLQLCFQAQIVMVQIPIQPVAKKGVVVK